MTEETVAWIGLGNMGENMARNVAEKGPQSSLNIYNRTPSRAHKLRETLKDASRVTICHSVPSAVSTSSIIFVCIGDDAALDQTVAAVLSSESLEGKILVNCSTVHPDTSTQAESLLAERGAYFVECPVCGPPEVAACGQLVGIPAGASHAVNRVKPFLEGVMCRKIVDMSGQPVAKASLMKLLGNSFVLTNIETLSESLVLAEKTGLGVVGFQAWIDIMFPGSISKYSNRMSAGAYAELQEPLFGVTLAQKDLGHALNLAQDNGVQTSFVETAMNQLDKVKASQGEKGDATAIYGLVRESSGLPFGGCRN